MFKFLLLRLSQYSKVMTREKKIEIIKKTEVFKNLSYEDFRQIAEVSKELNFKKGEIIFEENSNADGFYIICNGEVEILKKVEDTEQNEILAVKRDGDVFGEMAIIDDLPRSATIKAKTDITLLKLSRDIFNELLKSFSHIALEIARNVCSTVRSTNINYIRDLEKRNKQLKTAYQKLKKTQNELIQAEKLSLVGKFASLIIHDIKNPMSNIKAYAELISMNYPNDPKTNKSTSIIVKEVERLNNMASELLEFSRGDMQLNKTPVNISAFISTMIDIVKEDLKNKDIIISFNDNIDSIVLVDIERMKRVFLNLIINSADALLTGGKISIKLNDEDNWIKWSIQDNGFGMEEETLNRIFEPFFSYNKKGGTGLGMTIVKNIIEKHSGHIKCASKKNHGTKFEIFLPKA